MTYRAACALALMVYAAVVVIGAVSGHMSPDPFAEFDVPRSIGAVLLAFGVLLRVRRVDVLTVAYIVWLGIWGLLAIIGPLYQFMVPFGGGKGSSRIRCVPALPSPLSWRCSQRRWRSCAGMLSSAASFGRQPLRWSDAERTSCLLTSRPSASTTTRLSRAGSCQRWASRGCPAPPSYSEPALRGHLIRFTFCKTHDVLEAAV